jgi:hypothetical protein
LFSANKRTKQKNKKKPDTEKETLSRTPTPPTLFIAPGFRVIGGPKRFYFSAHILKI